MLKVNEIFGPTIQGEGKSLGKEVLFLRLAMCNLHCVWCDTPYTWRFDDKYPHNDNVVHSREKEVHEMVWEEVFERLKGSKVRALVISGGEPFLQQKQLIPLLRTLREEGWWIEIETNGTVMPNPEFVSLLNQINCSPKLANSGDPLNLRIRKKALEALVQSGKTNFKFVIKTHGDALEAFFVVRDTTPHAMGEIYFMPEGRTVEEIQSATSYMKELVEEFGVKFTTRQHIIQWGSKRGV